MSKKTTQYIIGIVLGYLFNSTAIALPLPCEVKLAQAAIPQNAFFLPESQAAQLQQALNKYGSVRLKPAGNYTRSFGIKLASNQAVYGLSGTKLPKVTLSAGTSNALLSGVSPVQISFEGFNKPITNNCINRISSSNIVANNVILENNLFTDLSNVGIVSDTSKQGYLKNNRFIRTMVHAGYPAITLTGDLSKRSAGNQFIWTNILTPQGEGFIIKNQKDISFIGLDAESWNWHKRAVLPGMMNVFNTDFLSVFMSNGGDNNSQVGQYFNLNATSVLLQGMNIGKTRSPGIILGNNVKNLLTISTLDIGLQNANNNNQVIDIFKYNKPTLSINNKITKAIGLPATSKAMIANTLQTEHLIFNNWARPTFPVLPDPAGSNWEKIRGTQPDSSVTIQALIDQNGIAELNAGIYYLAKPLTLKNGQGIIGAGANKTVLIAKTSDIDLIAGADHADETTKTVSFTLADITLQGGRNGLNHTKQGSGQGAQYNQLILSHVTFRNMKNTGILIDNIYAWDNNYIDHTNFYRCNIAIKQRPDPAYAGGDHIGMTYLDKNVFYQNQFIENDIALDWQANRGNNLNAFINCLFKNNRLTLNLQNTDSAFFANSVFESASNQPLMITNRITGFVNSYFVNKQNKIPLFNNLVYCNHCSFNNNAVNSGLVVSPTSQYSFFINSTLTKAVNQSTGTGLILNSNFSGDIKKPVVNTIFTNQTADPF